MASNARRRRRERLAALNELLAEQEPMSRLDRLERRFAPVRAMDATKPPDAGPSRICQENDLQNLLMLIADCESGPRVAGVPVRWTQDETWRCANLHVSKHFQQLPDGQRRCHYRSCQLSVLLTFPGDRSGPLVAPFGN